MRRWIISFAVLTCVSAGTMVACGGDDDSSTPTPDAGLDSSVTHLDSGTVITDSGSVDAAHDSGGSCISCAQAVATGPFNVCTTNGPPSSEQLVTSLLGCLCDVDAGCGTACAATCADPRNPPSTECQACFPVTCPQQLAACEADNGSDAGPPADAGDSGASDAGDAGDAGDASDGAIR